MQLLFGPYWDIYLTTLLSGVVGFILLVRRRVWPSQSYMNYQYLWCELYFWGIFDLSRPNRNWFRIWRFLHLICESETSFATPSKPAWKMVLLTNPETAVCVDGHGWNYNSKVWCIYPRTSILHFMWISLIYMYETVMWQNCCFTYIIIFLWTLYHHRDGFLHSIIREKPSSETSSGLTNWIGH